MKTKIIAAASLLALLTSSAAFAGDIYKWTDADGNVHYGDKPVGDTPIERVGIASQPTDPATVQAMTQARSDARAQAAEDKAAAAADEPSAEDLRAEAQERAQKCTSYRQQMQTFVASRRLYREDESGERVYLDEEQTRAARERVENQINEYCNS